MAVADTATTSFSSDDIVIKSPNDKRLYRYIQLPNGLSALLVHDPDIYADRTHGNGFDDVAGTEEKHNAAVPTKMAAAAMCVGMGSFCDPLEAQGLAHFLEHMLFMGSVEFPDENEYESYLSKHGGSSNAYTDMENTCYYFEVKPEFLNGALRRFSQFFISPLVKAEAMEREVLAVDSEFNRVLQSDTCRLEQLQRHTAAPGHAFNRFSWGNKRSLVDAVDKGINLRDQIFKLYNEYYHGGLMKLVIIGGESLDVLESWVLELFSKVKASNSSTSEVRSALPVWSAGKIYRLEAVNDVHFLKLSWILPCLRKDYLMKPENYLAHLIGHEGRGSLLFFLKVKGWVTYIWAGVGFGGMNQSSIAYVFSMKIYLTDSGLEKIYEIIGFVYQYLKLLQQVSPQEWIYQELKDVANMNFTFAEEQSQDTYAIGLSENLLYYPPEHTIYGNYAHEVWDEEMVEHVLSFLTPANMRTDLVSKSFNLSQDVQREPWFGSRYIEENISSSLLELWKDPPEIDVSLHLPAKNEFIPQNFSIRANSISSDSILAAPPKCILDDSLMKIWHKLDTTFRFPRANTYFRVALNGAYRGLKNILLTSLFRDLLKDKLNDIIYEASLASLGTCISLYWDNLHIMIYGYNDKLPVLLSKILETIQSFLPTHDRFLVIKEDMERSFRNVNMNPQCHSSYLRWQVLGQSSVDVDTEHELLKTLSLPDLQAFIPELFTQLYIEGLCHGNLLEEEAENLSNIFKKYFSVQPLPPDIRHKESILCLPSSADLVRDATVKNKLETNSVVELYYQIEPEADSNLVKSKALLYLFEQIVEEPLFNQLRTKEQLGYVVKCYPLNTCRILGFCFCVQSSEYSPAYLQGRIDNFINELECFLSELDDKSFQNYKGGLIMKLLEKDPSLISETNRYWNAIVNQRDAFNLYVKIAEAVKCLQKADIIEWYNTYLMKSSQKCRRLATRIWGCKTDINESKTESSSFQVIDDLAAFKASSTFYPSSC
uniref:nardilysin-like n=1 Tax=Erigeron canadensis TaxID=72917 RepID=UPI001CB8DB81|nr:nardilysin-like [Erigeron canadensis]